MHEQALLDDLRRKIEEVAMREGAGRVTRVRVWVGALSHLDETALRRAWPSRAAPTVARDAVLEVAVSHDPRDPRAQAVVLTSLDLEPGAPSVPGKGAASASSRPIGSGPHEP